ncbi:MAG: hypothetical protein V8S86_11780, partial [Eubacteriales bacterium]
QYELKGAVLEAPLEWQGLRLAPGRGGVLVTGLEGTDQRRFQRQLTVLKGYAALAADRRGERTLRLRQEDLPEREGPETLAAVWSGRAAKAEDQHGTLVACYNGFGALPGGFAAVEESLARWAGRPLGEKLLDYVQAVRREEGDLAEKAEPFQTLPSWTDRETGELLRALLRALCGGSWRARERPGIRGERSGEASQAAGIPDHQHDPAGHRDAVFLHERERQYLYGAAFWPVSDHAERAAADLRYPALVSGMWSGGSRRRPKGGGDAGSSPGCAGGGRRGSGRPSGTRWTASMPPCCW